MFSEVVRVVPALGRIVSPAQILASKTRLETAARTRIFGQARGAENNILGLLSA